ncbi:MAG: aldehyde dehydrogenase [Symploca sp. SIO3C6]|uniref:Aldehyde dehydrogenase n=1 Tax=Symploca sp. SIO1C4 TaxID=2607765 RepID=A0A6B3N7F7_9CYAN|nr:aldehyde dehydrogenase [Symploca sp. SIO3C6]NER27547.1 aldehyde dehydrogenase [Symploca sp. SIO1C4]
MNPLLQQRAFFNTGNTKPINFRIEQLQRLKQGIIKHQDAIVKAAKADLGRPEFEAYFEIGVLGELNRALKQLKSWVKPKRVATSFDQFPSTAWIVPEPLGVVLIIGPWNYPFQLLFSPLVGAIAAGNCAILKPSELAPHTSQAVAQLIQDSFEPAYIAVVEGGVETSQQLLAEKFDYIFFTGGTRVGKIIMEAAAKNLTPVTLELGGKNPCIVDTDIRLDYTAKRIAWGKFINAGQTCAAPDYLLVDQRIKSDLLKQLQQSIHEFFGDNPVKSPDYARIINEKHFSRLLLFLEKGKLIVGGEAIREQRYIAPTILDQVRWDDPVMQEEIFGPILPVLIYDNLEAAIAKINARPKPLALYLFSRNQQKQAKVLESTSSGGVCLNDTVMQYATWGLPFGGVGESGIGAYHGKSSFDTFSHYKSVLKKSFWLDLGWRYAPYEGKLGFLKKVITGS